MDETNNTEQAPSSVNSNEQKQHQTKWIIIIILAIAILYGIQSFFSPQRAVERAIEQATGGDVNLGEDGSVEFKGKDADGQNYNVSAGDNVSLPEAWPNSVPVISGAKISYAGSMNNGSDGSGLSVVYTTNRPAAEVTEYYKSGLVSGGWEIQNTIATGDGSMLSATKGENENVVVYIGSSDDETTVNISVQSQN